MQIPTARVAGLPAMVSHKINYESPLSPDVPAGTCFGSKLLKGPINWQTGERPICTVMRDSDRGMRRRILCVAFGRLALHVRTGSPTPNDVRKYLLLC